MKLQRFSVDTNILIYSIDKEAGTRHQQALEIMDRLPDTDCVLTLQALAEFFHAVTRKHKMPAEEASAMVQDWMELFPVTVADARTLTGAIRLKEEERFSFWDAMLVEAAKASGVTRLLSEDMQDGRVVGGLRLENPFKEDFDLGLD
ncbi:MAG: PIN domain-containing protein [Lamprobacter sp.]|uniref:PIN domain-containing protein n=1 Tax=Lamprobacter sp. TaxID=3100796 RepID=UPI002B25AE7D|nr:PIN domain-containing protein [Lamprobacter sp.]MEA3640568.1 PIN domain-containing protein [Lamprobacter sp.]